jgi:DUF4097 and DUF4098 domain-containing protein YvlB
MYRSQCLVLCGALLLLVVLGSCSTSINSSLEVADGETRKGSLSTVNGSITVGKGCVVEGSCRSVNGSVEVGVGSRVRRLSTVNGEIECDGDVTVDADVESVNGSLSMAAGSRVGGAVETINGAVDLVHTSVAGDVRTVNGRVRLSENSVVAGDLIVVKKRGNNRQRPLEIELDGGSVIEGNLIVEDPSIEVRVLLSGGSEIRGRVENADVVTRDI